MLELLMLLGFLYAAGAIAVAVRYGKGPWSFFLLVACGIGASPLVSWWVGKSAGKPAKGRGKKSEHAGVCPPPDMLGL